MIWDHNNNNVHTQKLSLVGKGVNVVLLALITVIDSM